MNYLKRRAESVKDRRIQQVFTVLLQAPHDAKTAEELGAATGLGAVVYPLLADLNREQFLELEWQHLGSDSQLAYRLTAPGLSYARHLTPTRENGFVNARGALTKPLYARLAQHISKRFGNSAHRQ